MLHFDEYINKGAIGKGYYCITYKVQHKKNKNKFALKVMKVSENDITPNYNKPVWKQLEFFSLINKFTVSQQEYFTNMYIYNFDKNHPIYIPPIMNNSAKILNSSQYCLYQLIDLKTGILNDIIINLNIKQKYVMIIHITYALFMMRIYGYMHNDIHMKNIGYKTTNIYKSIINIYGKQFLIRTHGYYFSLLDYGSITNIKYDKIQSYNAQCTHQTVYNDTEPPITTPPSYIPLNSKNIYPFNYKYNRDMYMLLTLLVNKGLINTKTKKKYNIFDYYTFVQNNVINNKIWNKIKNELCDIFLDDDFLKTFIDNICNMKLIESFADDKLEYLYHYMHILELLLAVYDKMLYLSYYNINILIPNMISEAHLLYMIQNYTNNIQIIAYFIELIK